jgi:hypothetical protein
LLVELFDRGGHGFHLRAQALAEALEVGFGGELAQRRVVGDGHDLFDVELTAQGVGQLLDGGAHLGVRARDRDACEWTAHAELLALADHEPERDGGARGFDALLER